MPKQQGRLTRRGRIWFGYVYENGLRKQVNTHCTDRQAALIELRRLEQEAADPRKAAAARTMLRQVLEMLVEHRWSEAKAGKRAPETAEFYAKKAGVLLRLFGEEFRLAQLDAPAVDAYVRARRNEGTSDHTIHKELTTLRAALRLALRARLWSGSLDEVLPDRFGAGYKPRERALTPDELSRLLGELTAAKAAAVAFMVATSANWRECTHARRDDIDPQSGWVCLRGTKRQTRNRRFVVAHPALLSLLRYAGQHAPGQDLLFPPWTNVRRDLIDACRRAGIERCSPNDLRRTYGRWMRVAAFPDEIIAPTMGHADTRMLERVYGKLSPEELSRRLLLHARAALPDCIANASVGTEIDGISRQAGLAGSAKSSELVPRGGIEPPTRGFSVPCSAD